MNGRDRKPTTRWADTRAASVTDGASLRRLVVDGAARGVAGPHQITAIRLRGPFRADRVLRPTAHPGRARAGFPAETPKR
jgi:hypothetical protein